MRTVCLIGIFALVMLAGCDEAALIKKMTPPEDAAVARSYIDMLRRNEFDLIEKDMDPDIKKPDLHDALVKMAALIPSEEPETIKVIGVNKLSENDLSSTNISFEYKFPSRWVLINVAVQKKGDVATIVGFNVRPIQDSLENLNRFTLVGKSPLHYAVLSTAALVSILSMCTLVLCMRTKLKKKKWPWLLFIILGVGQFTINWTTGQWVLTFFAVQLFSASVSSPTYSPWMISFSLPVGAVVFLLRLGKLRKPADAISPQNDTAGCKSP